MAKVKKIVKKKGKKGSGLCINEILAMLLMLPILGGVYWYFFYEDPTPYGYDSYGESIHEYLMQAPNYQAAYTSGKKVIVHYYDKDDSNPYFGLFKKAINDLQRTSDITEMYEFAHFFNMTNNRYFDGEQTKYVMKNERAMKKLCRQFCVINPEKREVYFWKQPRQRDLTRTTDIEGKEVLIEHLKSLEHWGIKLQH